MGLPEYYGAHHAVESSDFRFAALKALLVKNLTGRRILDVGCGSGVMVRELLKSGFDARGIEPDPRLFAIARKVVGDDPSTRVLNCGMADAPVDLLSGVDDILLLDVLEHIENDAGFLNELCSKMRPGCQLLCVVPALPPLYGKRDIEYGHFRRYGKENVRALFAACPFSDVSIGFWNFLGVPVYWWYERVLKSSVPEGFRLSRAGWRQRLTNDFLKAWFFFVENRVSFPLGLSLLVRARR